MKLGDVCRLRVCNKCVYSLITGDVLYWQFIALHIFKWKRDYLLNKSTYDIINSLSTTRKCRECGSYACYKTLCSTGKMVWLCVSCTRDKNGYSELYSRKQIFGGENVWSHKIRILKLLTIAKRGTNRKYLYWRWELKRKCAFLLRGNKIKLIPSLKLI